MLSPQSIFVISFQTVVLKYVSTIRSNVSTVIPECITDTVFVARC